MHMYDNFTCVNDFFPPLVFGIGECNGLIRWKKRGKKLEINISHQSQCPKKLIKEGWTFLYSCEGDC